MAYDYQAAKKAGATDEQILEYLNKTRGFDVDGAIKAGAKKEQVIDYLAQTTYGEPMAEKTEPKPEGVKGVAGTATGVTKNLLSFARGTAQVVENVGKGIIAAVNPNKTFKDIKGVSALDDSTEQGKFLKDIYTPQGNAEKIGSGIAEVATFAAPGSKLTKLGKAAEVAVAGKAGKVAGLGARATTEGAGYAGMTTLKEGEVNKDVIDTAILTSIFPVAGKAIAQGAKLSKASAEKFAPRVVNSLIKPLLKDLSYGKNPGKAVAEEGIIANNLDELATKINERRSVVGDQIGTVLSSPEAQSMKLNIVDSLNPIDDAIAQAQKSPRTNSALIKRLQDAKDDLLGVVQNADGSTTYTKKLIDVSPLEATGLKRDVGDITKFTGNASDDNIVNGALKKVYGSIKGTIDDAVPAVKPFNERYADLTSAKIATEYRDKIAERQNLISFGEGTIGTGSALVTALSTGGAAIPTILMGLGAGAVTKVAKSVGFKTRLAAYLASASAEEKKALFNKVPWFKAIAVSALIND